LQCAVLAVVHEDVEIVVVETFDRVYANKVGVWGQGADDLQLLLDGFAPFEVALETDYLCC
jgi:hypothetical protein